VQPLHLRILSEASKKRLHSASRLDQSPRMPRWAGPCEPTIATLADGRVFLAFRLGGGQALWTAFSRTHGASWGEPTAMKGAGGHKPFAVWPQAKVLSNGVLVVSSGRPGIGFYLSPSPNPEGATWLVANVTAEHTKNLPADPWLDGDQTTSYTSMAEVAPGAVLHAYDKRRGCVDCNGEKGVGGKTEKVYSVRINVTA